MSDAVVTAYEEWKRRNITQAIEIRQTLIRITDAKRFVPIKEERCKCCKLSYQNGVELVKHLKGMPHIARKFGVSVVALARVKRGQEIIHGVKPKRKKRKIKRWQDREPEEKLNLAEKNLINWLKKKEKAERSDREEIEMFSVTWNCSDPNCTGNVLQSDPLTTDVSEVDVTIVVPKGWMLLPDAVSGGMKLFCDKCAKGLDVAMVEKARKLAKKREERADGGRAKAS